jgi:hypothetical protein
MQFFHYTNFSHFTHYLREEFKMNIKLATSRICPVIKGEDKE